LKDYLSNKPMLLVLDNCEHLIDECARVADALLHGAPQLKILATSREALGITGENAFHVQSLSLPDPSADSVAAVSQCDAVRLLIDRTVAAQASFHLSNDNAHAVAQICTRLDGIPLALELAAARASGMTVEQIASRLDDRFRLLTGGSRTALPRQRTLQATIDWSHDLLSAAERVLFRRLSIFAGGWTLEAAQTIAASDELRAQDVRELLPGLVQKSLVRLDLSGGRYHMLEIMREYGLARLNEAGEDGTLRTRHLDFFIALAESSELASSDTAAFEGDLAREYENLLTAIQWCASAENGVQKGMQLVGAARHTWYLLGQYGLALQLARKFLALPEAGTRNIARRRALLTAAQAGFFLGRADETREALEESLTIARQIGDRRGEAFALDWLANISLESGEEEAALRSFREALAIAEQLPFRRLIANIRNDMAVALRLKGELAEAESMFELSAAILREIDSFQNLTVCLLNLSLLALQKGSLPVAKERLRETVQVAIESPFAMGFAGLILLNCAAYLAAAGDWGHAALLHGASERQREQDGIIAERADRLVLEPLIEHARVAMGDNEYQEVFADGQQLPLDRAMDEARVLLGTAL
jgi:non-specific serine/threonine protein kinase